VTATGPAERPSARFTASTAVLLVLALLAAFVLRNIFVAAHRVIGWGVATVVVATLLEPPITWLSRFVPKVLALLLAGLGIAAVAGALVYGVFDDLETETSALRDRGPAAAARLEERDDRIGDVARDLRLTERADDAFEALEERFGAGTQVLASAAGTVPSYFVSFILTIFFILYGNRIFEGAVDQVDDPRRRRRLEHVVRTGVRRGRSYLWWALLQGSVVGGATFLVADELDLPAPTVLALVAAVAASVPYIGIVIGVVPTVLMAAGLQSPQAGGAIVAVALAAQVVEALVVRRLVDRRTLHVGPAIPVIVGSVGLEVYGIGGALYGVALAVFLLAAADAAATEADEPLPTPNQDWVGDPAPSPDPDPRDGGGGEAAHAGEEAERTAEPVSADDVGHAVSREAAEDAPGRG
jgi:predicted PurR-regulated permease PerM